MIAGDREEVGIARSGGIGPHREERREKLGHRELRHRRIVGRRRPGNELDVEQGRERRASIEGPSRAVAGAGDDDGERVAARPAGPAHDLLDHVLEVGRLLIGACLPSSPGSRRPAHRCRGTRSRRRPRRRGECRGVVGGLPLEQEVGGDALRLVGAELDVGVEYRGAERDGEIGPADAHRLKVAAVLDQLEIAARESHGGSGLLGVVR